jgi:molecular chaperone Hsp33
MTRAKDTVMPFEIKPLGVRGRVVRLGAVIDDIVRRHDYPPVVSALLAEAVALTAMLGATLKFEGSSFCKPDRWAGYDRGGFHVT